MPQDQQAFVLLALLGLGVFLLLPKREEAPPILPSAQAPPVQPYFQNDETWEVKRDGEGRVTGFIVHRNVQVAKK